MPMPSQTIKIPLEISNNIIELVLSKWFYIKLYFSGANIGLKNLHGEAPISRILPSTMEEYLNKHCMRTSGNPTNDEFK